MLEKKTQIVKALCPWCNDGYATLEMSWEDRPLVASMKTTQFVKNVGVCDKCGEKVAIRLTINIQRVTGPRGQKNVTAPVLGYWKKKGRTSSPLTVSVVDIYWSNNYSGGGYVTLEDGSKLDWATLCKEWEHVE